ncbi:MAG: hypothetical protein RLZ44_1327 [Pseudomonadota bacterium]|jgi:hypothetical protein
MLEYVFFDERPYERFVAFVREQGLVPVCDCTEDGFEVALPEDLEAGLGERIEAFYDQMLELNQALYDHEAGQGNDNYHAAGVVLQLQDGNTVYAKVDPALLGRVMTVLTPQEFGDIVNAIVDAVERPDSRTLCQRQPGRD